MKRWMTVFAVVGLLVGCASTPEEESGAKVVEAKPTVTQPKPAASKPPSDLGGRAARTDSVAVDPLKDPNNILSRRSIFFDYDQFVVKEEFKPVVSAHARYLQQHGSAHVTIQGNADERGSREYNLALGQKRADAVRQAMTLLGANASQIETVSFGEEKPRAQGANEQAYAENRRADIVYRGE